MDNQGRGITYFNDKIVFVNNALPGEDVDLNITIDKKRYSIANVKSYIKKSDKRIEAKCPYFNICGGCQLQHLNYQEQLEYKQNNLIELFKPLNINNIDIVKSHNFFYRDKLTLQVHQKIGLFEINSNNIVPIDKCIICDDLINEKIKYLNLLDTNKIKKIIIKSFNNETMLVIIGNDDINLNNVLDYFDHIYLNNTLVKGSKIIANLKNLKYYVSPHAFFQVNPYITCEIYELIKNICIKNKLKKVLDLYCGCGSISLFIANEVEKVVGVEINESSIKDALLNKELNNIKNAKFICSDTNNIEFKKDYDAIIVDPPRSGLSKTVINKILDRNFKNIIYVSCDPITLLRDLKILNETYNIEFIKAFDMFPNTYHIETVTLLTLK